jgi:hypothetical protein
MSAFMSTRPQSGQDRLLNEPFYAAFRSFSGVQRKELPDLQTALSLSLESIPQPRVCTAVTLFAALRSIS